MNRRFALSTAALALAAGVSLAASAASAGSLYDPGAAGFQPRVPISTLASAASWFDRSRLHMSSTFSVGSGFGSGTSALQTTRFSYEFKAPISMSVSVGNAFGPGSASRNASFFLQGVDLAYRPSANSVLQFQFRDVRSPMQYGLGYGRGDDRALWGY